jgi:hypothetical protein
MKLILTTMVLMSIAFGAQAQYVTYNHDASKMNQITVEETGTGTLKPEVYYWLLHNKYKKTASVKNKLTFRTSAGIASYQQVDIAETIDSALTSRAKIEAMNMTDRQIDLAWLAEGEKIESQMVKFQKNIDRILIAGGTPKERERWNKGYQGCLYAKCTKKESISANLRRHNKSE